MTRFHLLHPQRTGTQFLLEVALDREALLAKMASEALTAVGPQLQLRLLPEDQLMLPLYSKAPNPSSVLGVFGLSIRTQERDLDEEFSRFGRVEKVTIVYDQRSDRSRGFGFIRMATTEDATRCIQELNGVDLNGRRIRVDYSVTDRPHAPTPGEYMGHRRATRDTRYDRDKDRDRDYRDSRDSYRDRDRRDYYGRDSRDWRERRSPPPRSGRYSPEYRRRRSYSRSPPRGSSPSRPGRDFDAPPAPPAAEARW
ncbi:hypothetical protein GGU11DRAFT_740440 [Lentinula aff. detonsa]|nr:hypothetical protein GGU11DRAFT_740440 [Lentinula aff. detonsa]